uniref:Uncharacterized protein n=1 Tax=Pithovirus LCDPAC01 TaxID=2506600 RepID=A0A481YQG1_9VIRU|nr:MAG: hypothetical protein LCDPAC01_01340 [Pithovirus LCDPAC01]
MQKDIKTVRFFVERYLSVLDKNQVYHKELQKQKVHSKIFIGDVRILLISNNIHIARLRKTIRDFSSDLDYDCIGSLFFLKYGGEHIDEITLLMSSRLIIYQSLIRILRNIVNINNSIVSFGHKIM